MNLNYKILGRGEPLIVLHGLYGMLDNWVSIARILQNGFKIVLVDLRNHGKSEHASEHNYQVMVEDLVGFMNQQQIFSANILGHSMGGKLALAFAAYNPERVKRLIVVDISPRTYSIALGDAQLAEHEGIMQALLSLDLSKFKKREEADLSLSALVSSERVRTFLLKNLNRTADRKFEWKLNLPVLSKNLNRIIEGLESNYDDFKQLNLPVLFIKGGDSDYIKTQDEQLISHLFKNVTIRNVERASHWVHADNPAEFIAIVNAFLENNSLNIGAI